MGFKPVRLGKSTTAFSPVAGTLVVSTVKPPALQRQAVTEETLRDPESMKQTLQAMQEAARTATSTTSPLDGGVVLGSEDGITEGINFTAGVAKTINHRLGHRPKYVVVLSAWQAAAQFFRIDQTAEEDAVSIRLQFTNTTRVVLWVGP